MKKQLSVASRQVATMGILAVAVSLGGCAAGSATAGYSAMAGSADELGSGARQRIVDEATTRSNAYTDAKIAELRAELLGSGR